MAEKSIFWTTGQSGDGAAPYTESEIFAWIKRTFLKTPASQGVLKNYANALAVSGSASPLTVATGAAVVNGIPYENDAAVSLAVPTPTVGTTGKRVVLRADYTANTVRITLITSADGVSAFPALTQNSSIWEIPIANLSVTTGGAITVSDARGYAHFNTAVDTSMLDTGIVDVRRQGAPTDAVNWNEAGTTNYVPGRIKMQAGLLAVTIPIGEQAVEVTVTFPTPFSGSPLTFATPWELAASTKWATVGAVAVSPNQLTQVNLHASRPEGEATTATHLVYVNWLAIGPE